MKTFIFPGQGSQTRGMGEALFDDFKELTKKADKILGYSVKELCLEDPGKELNKTQFTQPALYVVNAFSYYKKIEETGQKPDFVTGHSLGEYNALLAAECFDFEAGLKLVKKRGELMSDAPEGAMAAILNADKKEIEAILEKNGLKNIDLANYNTLSQIVISGSKEEIIKAQGLFQTGNMLYYPLNTSGAFHSRFMQPIMEKFEAYLKKFKVADLKIPVISNYTARPYQNNEIVTNLSNQIANAVKWSDSIQYLLNLSDESNNSPMEFEEIGHGEVLTKLVTKIREEIAIPRHTENNHKQIEINIPSVEKVQASDKKPRIDNSTSEQVRDTPDRVKVVETQLANDEKSNIEKENNVQSVSEEKTLESTNISAGETDSITTKNSYTVTEVEEKVKSWNQNYPIGTKVKSSILDSDDLETRTSAVILFGHRAAVYLKGYNGYFDLNEIVAL